MDHECLQRLTCILLRKVQLLGDAGRAKGVGMPRANEGLDYVHGQHGGPTLAPFVHMHNRADRSCRLAGRWPAGPMELWHGGQTESAVGQASSLDDDRRLCADCGSGSAESAGAVPTLGYAV